MNSYQLAKQQLSDMQAKRAKMLIKIKDEQTELSLLKDNMIGKDAESTAVTKYNACKNQVAAFLDVLEDMDKKRIPALKSKINQEKAAVSTKAQIYLNKKKCIAITAIQKALDEGIQLMDRYEDDTAAYSKAEGNPNIPYRLTVITITDMSKLIRKRLS